LAPQDITPLDGLGLTDKPGGLMYTTSSAPSGRWMASYLPFMVLTLTA